MRTQAVFIVPLSLLAFGAGAADIDFAHDIVPIIREHCSECHTGDKKKGGFSMNSRTDLIKGGENGATIVPGKSAESKLIKLVTSTDDEERMPPPGKGRSKVTPEQLAKLKKWIDAGAPWADGFAFKKPAYEPPLKPRRPELPPATDGRQNPIDRILDSYLAKQKLPRPQPVSDTVFLRRIYLDLIGLLPEPETLEKFLADKAPDKRARLVRELLADNVDYAEHWLTFWNDLLRNDYAGTGYIDGGRKQISDWLYRSLVDNKPYDQFVRELIAPNAESEGFARGIKWRGTVSAGQEVPVQFAQSVGQTFLGINLKCASCHDSFIDRWKLDDAYGLAAVYSPAPIEIHRCDKPTGKQAVAGWIFPELGKIDGSKPPNERLKQLATLMTHPENGRTTRTIVNRLWHRLMGRGIVHPVDAMQSEPWNADLLDFLAVHLADNKYDLKKTLELICLSEAYQSHAEIIKGDAEDKGYVYAGPRARRLTAEQFTDAIWQITGTAPTKIDAPVKRGKVDPAVVKDVTLSAQWIWSSDGAAKPHEAGETITLRKELSLAQTPQRAGAAITCDNSFTLYVNGKKIAAGENWEEPSGVMLDGLKQGANEILIVAKNGGTAPNPAGLFFEARLKLADGSESKLITDASWQWTSATPDGKGKFKQPPEWKPAIPVANSGVWNGVNPALQSALGGAAFSNQPMARAALMKSDLLMRTLGRPNREQIVSTRPNDLSTLEAMDLNNGQILTSRLEQGAQRLLKRNWESSDSLAKWLYAYALSRQPTSDELALARDVLGAKPSVQGVQDLLWALLMLPEFQLVR
ncbi:MAG TPA: DUF1549 domain-containing protein [Planctomycetota bacterium]|nr:DUF1549 domain-containing protein [Planctomycetota bacterium]